MGGGMLNLGDRNSPQSTVCATAWDALKPHVPSHFPLPRTRRSCMLSCMDSMFSMRRSLCFMTCFSSLPAACGHGREGGAERARWVLEPRAWGLSCTAAERRRPAGSLGRLPGADGITNRTKAPTPSTGVSASTSTHTHSTPAPPPSPSSLPSTHAPPWPAQCARCPAWTAQRSWPARCCTAGCTAGRAGSRTAASA